MSHARGRGVDPKNHVVKRGEARSVSWFNQEFVLRKQVLRVRNSECSRRKTVLTFEMLRPDV